MEAKELRIGNYYKYASSEGIVTKKLKCIKINEFGFFSDLDGTNLEICKPIPLTEEILLKCGATKVKTIRNGVKATYELNGFRFEVSRGNNIYHCTYNKIIYYIHQLQNLYFALTNEELEINL